MNTDEQGPHSGAKPVHPDQRGQGIRLSDAPAVEVRDCHATKVRGDGIRLGAWSAQTYQLGQ